MNKGGDDNYQENEAAQHDGYVSHDGPPVRLIAGRGIEDRAIELRGADALPVGEPELERNPEGEHPETHKPCDRNPAPSHAPTLQSQSTVCPYYGAGDGYEVIHAARDLTLAVFVDPADPGFGRLLVAEIDGETHELLIGKQPGLDVLARDGSFVDHLAESFVSLRCSLRS